MGYSCTKDAGDKLNAIAQAYAEFADHYSSGRHKFGHNVMLNNSALPIAFFERGRENADGAVTGKVMKMVDKFGKIDHDGEYAVKVGNYRIEPDGTITRFPLLLPEIRKRADEIIKTGALRNIGAI